MAYDTVPVTAGSGTNIVSKQTATGHIQVVRLDIGVDAAESAVATSLPINDAGGSITVDGTVAVSGTVPVSDNGGSLTVDGTVAATQSGTWNITNISGSVSLPAGAATATNQATAIASLATLAGAIKAEDAAHSSGDAGIMALAVRQNSQSDLGADGDYVPMTVADDGGLRVNVTNGAAGGTSMTDDGVFTAGTTAVTPVAGVYAITPDPVSDGDAGALAMTIRRALHTSWVDNAGDPLGQSATTPISVQISNGTDFPTVGVDYTHDTALTPGTTAGPILMARASLNEPTAVSAADDAVLPWADLHGRLVVLDGHANPEAPVTVNATSSGNTTVVAAPGASVSLYVRKGSIHNRDSSAVVAILQDGAGGTNRWRAELAPEGGGSTFDFGSRGWKLTANTLLNVNLSGAGSVDVNVTDYYIAP
jgi:hypothetical protein